MSGTQTKAAITLQKHKVSFEDAREALDDPSLVYLEDRICDGELRHQAIGLLVMVAHTIRGNDEQTRIRIISARSAEPNDESSIISVPAGTPICRTPEDIDRLRWLASRPDSEIDFSDIPRLSPEEHEASRRKILEVRVERLKQAS